MTPCLPYSRGALIILLGGCFSLLQICTAEVLLQDVLWSRNYQDEFDENYYGKCRFVQSPCGDDYYNPGVCIPSGRCHEQGGSLKSSSSCQNGVGECCTFTEQCNGTQVVQQLVTILTPPYNGDTEGCSFTFRKEPNICQILLNFTDTTKLAPANAEGICDTDRLVISNSKTTDGDFVTCGDLTGQHMYLTFGTQDSIHVTPIIRDTSSQYRIVATKIPCNSPKRAPDYCLQHFTATTGTVKSFDFGGQQQNNQRYTVCVKPAPQSSSIQWKPCSVESGNSFDIISNVDGLPTTNCKSDWVQVRGQNRVCDGFHSTPSSWKPYDLSVNFDEMELPPPPPSITIPVDPQNCEAACTPRPGYSCACVDGTGSGSDCLCSAESVGDSFPADIGNTGFCLEYSQL